MPKIKLYKTKIEVPKEIKKLYEKDEVFDSEEWLKILSSNGYKNGKITIETLKWLTDEKTNNKHHLLTVLSSNNYAKGIVEEEDLKFLETIGADSVYTLLKNAQARCLADILTGAIGNGIDTYKRGLIPPETLKLITQTKDLSGTNLYEHPEYFVRLLTSNNYANGLIPEEKIQQFLNVSNIIQVKILDKILSSKNYAIGIISDDMINKALETEDRDRIFTFLNLITSTLYANKQITDETLKLILDNKNELITIIIHEIELSHIIKEEDKINYIEAILKLENKEQLNNLYYNYKSNQYVRNMTDFAHQFILYALPIMKMEVTDKNLTRKKQKQ